MSRGHVKGYLTIYLSLTLTVMLSLCLTLIEGARRSSIRLETECVTDIGLHSVLGEYHRELFRQYNLFYVDSSYGTGLPTYCNTQARLEDYIRQNLDLETSGYFDFVYKDLLGVEILDVYIGKVAFASDDEGRRIQKKAAKAMLDEVGVGLVDDVLDWVGVVEQDKLQEYDVTVKRQQVNHDIEERINAKKEEDEEKWYSIEMPDLLGYLNGLLSEGLLLSVLEGEKISTQVIEPSEYISARRKNGALNVGNAMVTESVTPVERVLFHTYLLRHTGYYGKEKAGGLLRYQVEYLLNGKSSDKENLTGTMWKLCALRSAANLLFLYKDEKKVAAAQAVAKAAAAVILMPELEFLMETSILLGWAYVEGMYDVKVLLKGGKIPLMKSSEEWHYDLDSILESADMQVSDSNQKGLDYAEYLQILLFLADGETTAFRFMDIVEMDVRQTAGNQEFRMDGCIDYLEVTAIYKSRFDYRHVVRLQKEYE